ncbi:Septum formation protein Maf, partial [hydrothermal vent metagenome]
MTKAPQIILASGSAIRANLLRGAGVSFEVVKPNVNEAAIKTEAASAGKTLEQMAMTLAEAKCLAVAKTTDAIVIGADQILEFEDRAFDKPQTMDEARTRLMEMAGAAHRLINAVAIAKNGRILWRNLERPELYLRNLTEAEIDAYLAAAGPEILTSVGAYQIEGVGARLFDKIDGDY